MNHPLHNRAIFWLIVVTLFWSISFPFVQILYVEQRSLLPGASTFFLACLLMAARFAMACLLMLPYLLWRRQKFTAAEWRQGMYLALFGGLGMWLQADALAYTKASTCAFITQGYCVFLPIFHAIKTRTLPGLRLVIALIMVVTGVGWLSGVKASDISLGRGEAETLLAALLFTMQILCLENPRYSANRSMPITWIMFFGITLLAIPFALAASRTPIDCLTALSSPAALGIIAALAVFCSIIAYGMMNHWQAYVHSVEAGLIYCAEPLFTTAVAMFLPAIVGRWIGHPIANETWTFALIGGGLLITAANIILQQKPQTHPAHHHPSE